jgi:MerR family copper efflux transcriptional regulator
MRIGELAKAAGMGPKAIRFYEQERLLPDPGRTASGYRDYPPAALDRLTFIRDAQAAGLTLAEIGQILAIRDAGQVPCAHVTALIAEHLERIEARIAELEQTRAALRTLAAKAEATAPQDCDDTAICRILSDR